MSIDVGELKRRQREMWATGEGYVDYLSEKFGPMIGARATLEADGRWESVRREVAALFEGFGTPDGDGFEMEYLLVLGRKPS